VQMGLIADDRVNRVAVPKVLHRVARILKAEDIEICLGFLVSKACLDENEEVAESGQEAAKELVLSQGEKHGNAILAILESFVKDPSSSNDAKNQACILLATLAPFLENTSAKKLQATVEILFELSAKV